VHIWELNTVFRSFAGFGEKDRCRIEYMYKITSNANCMYVVFEQKLLQFFSLFCFQVYIIEIKC